MPPDERLMRLLFSMARANVGGTRLALTLLGYPERFAEAALANREVQENIRDFPRVWTAAGVAQSPPMRWEFDIVTAWGGPSVLAWARGKSGWGDLVAIEPLEPDDPVHPMFLECRHKPNSPYLQKRDQRCWLKERLGRRWRKLVAMAMRETQENFVGTLSTGLVCCTVLETAPMADATIRGAVRTRLVKTTPDGRRFYKCWQQVAPDWEAAEALKWKLRMSPQTFWQHVRGKPISPRRMHPQGLLFE